MVNYYSVFFILFFSVTAFCQNTTSKELLNRSIAYHDPNDQWNSFQGSMQIIMETPNQSKRVTNLQINLPKEYFYAQATREGHTTEFILKKDTCSIKLNGKDTFTEEEVKKYKLTCQRAKMVQNYYTYLYGLPMKLKDPGTIIDDEVVQKTFKGKEYLVIKVSYTKEVGNDIWYFYFNPKTFAMEIYQFFHYDAASGKEKGGEYILLSELEVVNGIKMPKIRAWYTNEEDQYLGTDILNLK